MQIELSQDEIETINSALDAWERDIGTSGLLTGIFGAIMGGDKKNAEHERQQAEQKAKDDALGKVRKIKSTLLRAKLITANLANLTS